MRLTLTAEDFAGPNRWYWRLQDGDRLLADHEVQLDPADWQYEAYLDLSGYLRVHASPGVAKGSRGRKRFQEPLNVLPW
jgi:hypothetical protein